jgi:transcriptional regulator with XRE-family HTH domain
MQKEVANAVGVYLSNYSKKEKGKREFGTEVIDKLAKFFGLTIDELVHPNNKLPREVKVEDKTANEKVHKNKFQTFFEQNIAVK